MHETAVVVRYLKTITVISLWKIRNVYDNNFNIVEVSPSIKADFVLGEGLYEILKQSDGMDLLIRVSHGTNTNKLK